MAASAAFLAGNTQAAVLTNTFNLGPLGTPTTFGGAFAVGDLSYFHAWDLGSLPAGSILRSVSINATIESTDANRNWADELDVLVEPSTGLPGDTDGILKIYPGYGDLPPALYNSTWVGGAAAPV